MPYLIGYLEIIEGEIKMNDLTIYNELQYRKALKELLIILKYIPKNDYRKIPEDVIRMININAEHSYNFYVDEKKSLKDQNISELTKAMLENFYRDYWVTEIEKNKIIEEENKKRKKIEEQKKIRYNPEIIFKKNKKNLSINYEREEEMSLINVQEEKLLKKISAFIKRIISR